MTFELRPQVLEAHGLRAAISGLLQTAADDDLDTTDGFDVVGANDDDALGTILYRSSSGTTVVTVDFLVEQYSVGGAARCLVAGAALIGQ